MQADQKIISQLTQLQSTQTLGRKKFLSEEFNLITKQEVEEQGGRIVSVVKDRKRKLQDDSTIPLKRKRDPNIVDLGVSKEYFLPIEY